MKIQSSAGFQSYKNYISELKSNDTPSLKGKDGQASLAQNTDTVSFSGSAAAQAEIGRISSRVASEVEHTAREERLSQLSESIAQGSYFISSDALASSILGEA